MKGGADQNTHPARHIGVIESPEQMIDHPSDQGGKVDVNGRRLVAEVGIDQGRAVSQDEVEVPF